MTTFFNASDCRLYLALWRKYAALYHLDVHTYCLMPNHVHFLVTPAEKDSISRVTRVVGSTYASYVNKTYCRTGTLWEGRHRSCLVDSDRYVIACYRYIESNPVRAGLVDHPAQYEWSSYRFNASASENWLTAHPSYLGLGAPAAERMRVYRELVEQPLGERQLSRIRAALNACVPLARADFVANLERRHGIRFGTMQRGRPPGKLTSG